MFMSTKNLRAAVAAFVVAALLPVSAAVAMPTAGERPTSDTGFAAAVESIGSSIWHACTLLLAKYGIRIDPNGGPH
jgi:hypothetical protein